MEKQEMRKLKCGIAAGILILASAVSSHAALLSVTNVNSIDPNDVYELSLGDLANGEPAHIDRTHTVTNLPTELEGADYVLTANDDKVSTNVEVTVTFDRPTTLYLSIDNRVGNDSTATPPTFGTLMGWVPDQGWQQTDMTWEKAGDLGKPYTVYTLVSFGTSHTFYEENYGGNMYSIAAKELEPGPVRYALIDIGPNGQRIEPEGGGPTGAPARDTNGADYGPTKHSAVGFYDTYELSVGSADWRDRGNATGTVERLVRLGEDFVKHNNGTLTLTLGDLPAGHY